jgi:hypothetical protein
VNRLGRYALAIGAQVRCKSTTSPALATNGRLKEQKILPDVSICGLIARHVDRGRVFGAVSLVGWSTRYIQEQSNVEFSCQTDP